MKKSEIIETIKRASYEVRENENKYSIHDGKIFIGAIRFYEDYPHILLDTPDNKIKSILNKFKIEQKIKFEENELF